MRAHRLANAIDWPLEDRIAPVAGLVRDINTINVAMSSNPQELVNVGGVLYFHANDGVNGDELWRSSGTAGGTTLVRNIRTGAAGSSPDAFTNVGGVLFFTANDGVNGYELWRSDGTSAGTTLVRNITTGAASAYPDNLTNVGGVLYFRASDGLNGYELWRSNGTSTGTTLVRNINAAPAAGSYPDALTNVGGVLYFRASEGLNGYELWRSNGTSTGTTLVRNINTAPADGSYPAYLTAVGGAFYFRADDGVNGNELWRSDGTSAGTTLVRNILAGTLGSYPFSFTNFAGTLVFTANEGVNGYELWRSDGTSTGTSLVRDINPGSASASPHDLTPVDGVPGALFFAVNDGANGVELWRSDGTSTGTTLVRDINSGTGSSNPGQLTNVGGTLHFQANDASLGTTLWRSDGTSAGTFPVVAQPADVFTPNGLTVVGSSLFFAATTVTLGTELFKPPLIARVRSASGGTFTTGQSLNVTIDFSETAVLAGGNLTVALDSGATLTIAPFSGTSATAAYVIQSGQTSPDLTVTGFTLAPGATLRDAAGRDADLLLPVSNLNVNANILVNPLPPTTVSMVSINGGNAQRSRVTSLQLDFATAVNAAFLAQPGTIALTRTSGGPPVTLTAGSGISIAPFTGSVTGITLTFNGTNGVDSTSLADGRWQLSIPWLQYTSPLNSIHRLFGDDTADGTVSGAELLTFGNAFNSNDARFDFDNDGTIGGADFLQFGNRFGVTV